MNRKALLIIDLQTGMLDGVAEPPLHGASGLIERTCGLIAAARAAKVPVAFVRHDGAPGDSLAPGAPGWPVWPALGQLQDEPTFAKNVGDAFSNSALPRWLEGHGARTVILAGAQTDACVAATVKGALAAGYAVEVAGDCHSTWAFGGRTAAEIIAASNTEFAGQGAKVVAAETIAAELAE